MAGRGKGIVVTHGGGLEFVADVRGHRVVTDQPLAAGGGDAGPMPVEMVGVALASCVALYVEQFCRARGIATEGMRVELETAGARDPNRIGLFDMVVHLPEELEPRYAEAIDRIARSCAVYNTLMHAPEVRIAVAAAEAGTAVS
ncbi:MAG TPA: OsmC family protein [Longimicrobiales bacterium]|nr:OsmC family protein [Longimicrobiales bacterium]